MSSLLQIEQFSPLGCASAPEMVTIPSSHFVTLPNRPVVQPSGDVQQAPLTLHYWQWQGHQPTILLCHAASFHGRCYDRVIDQALHGFHVIAVDLRGHGQSQQHPPPYRFSWFGGDILALVEQLDLPTNDLIGIGHSLGGYALTWAAAKASSSLFRSLILFDPGVVPRPLYGIGDRRVAAFDYILRRKSQWASVDEMVSKMEKREPFSRWPKDVLRSYCTYALDNAGNLRCSPEGEHSMYQSSLQSDSNVYPMIEQSKSIDEIPIHIVRSSLPLIIGRFETSPTEPELVKWFKRGHDTLLKDTDHLFPMERPQLMIDSLKGLIPEKLRSRL